MTTPTSPEDLVAMLEQKYLAEAQRADNEWRRAANLETRVLGLENLSLKQREEIAALKLAARNPDDVTRIAALEAQLETVRSQLADSDRRLLKVHEALDEEYDEAAPHDEERVIKAQEALLEQYDSGNWLSVTPHAAPPPPTDEEQYELDRSRHGPSGGIK